MTTITINERTVVVPANWNDLELKPLLTIFHILTAAGIPAVGQVEMDILRRLEIAKVILGIDQEFLNDWKQIRLEEIGDQADAELVFFSELDEVVRAATSFLFEPPAEGEEDKQPTIRLGLTRCPWPSLASKKKHNSKTKALYAPADWLDNVTLYELATVFTLFEGWIENQSDELANELLATLYRPPKQDTKENRRSGYEGDIRQPWRKHESLVKKRKEKFKELPVVVKSVLMFWFASCRADIVRQYENIFKKKTEGAVERSGNDYSWGGVLLSLSNGLANLDQIQDRNFHDAFIYLSMLEDQRLEDEMWGRSRRRLHAVK